MSDACVRAADRRSRLGSPQGESHLGRWQRFEISDRVDHSCGPNSRRQPTASPKRFGCLDAQTLAGEAGRELLLVGYMGAFRRFQFVTLDVEHRRRPTGGSASLSAAPRWGPGSRRTAQGRRLRLLPTTLPGDCTTGVDGCGGISIRPVHSFGCVIGLW